MEQKSVPHSAEYNAPPAMYGSGGTQPPPPNPAYPAPGPAAHAAPAGPAPGYGHTSATTVVVTQPGMVMGGHYGPNACTTTCPHCRATVTTAVTRSCGGFVWLIAGIICLVGLFFMGITWLGCCLIPFCIPSLYDSTHTCPNCGQIIGQYTHF